MEKPRQFRQGILLEKNVLDANCVTLYVRKNALIYLQFRLLSTRIIVCIAEDVQKFVRSSAFRKEVKYDLKKIRKGHVDWNKFLCGIPAKDYVFQKDAYEDQIKNAAKLLKDADAVIIGAGAGASTAAGLAYGGKRFRENFAEFIGKYGGQYMTDMYAAGFLSISFGGSKMGLLVQTCADQPV